MGKSVARITKPPAVPRLRDGERLDIAEFLRRYSADTRVLKAELIRGVVHVLRSRVVRNGKEIIVSPIDAGGHSAPHANLVGWLSVYAAYTANVIPYAPVTNIQPERENGLEPDGALRIHDDAGGQTEIGEDGYIHGPPELFLEVANTSRRRDTTVRRDECETAGVKEYLVWQTQAGVVEWFTLKRKKYALLSADAAGIVRSAVFPGLWLDVPALLAGDMARVLAVVQQGIASPEHAAFVAKLQKSAAKRKK
jgi:Uma2 family endonuclease